MGIDSLSPHLGICIPQTKQLLPSAAKFEQKNGAAVMRKPLRGVMKLHQDFSLCLKDPHFFQPNRSDNIAGIFFLSSTSIFFANWITDMSCDSHLQAILHLLKRLKTWVAPSLAPRALACTSDNHPLSYKRAPSLVLTHHTGLVQTHVFFTDIVLYWHNKPRLSAQP